MRNVARTWAYETGRLVGVEMGSELPFTDYYEYYSPDFELDVRPSNMDNANSPEYLDKIKAQVYENLRRTAQAPSVQMTEVPRYGLGQDETLDEEEARLDDAEADLETSKDRRITPRLWDKKVERGDEMEESEDDEEIAHAAGVRRQPGDSDRPKRRGIMDYANPHAPADDSGAGTPVDVRSLNGDAEDGEDDGAMQTDGAADTRPAAAVVAADLAAMKVPAAEHENGEDGDGDISEQSDPGPDADGDDGDMDVDMDDEEEDDVPGPGTGDLAAAPRAPDATGANPGAPAPPTNLG